MPARYLTYMGNVEMAERVERGWKSTRSGFYWLGTLTVSGTILGRLEARQRLGMQLIGDTKSVAGSRKMAEAL